MIEKILVALDVESGARALALADALRGRVGGFKIGSRLFTAEGPAIVRALVERGDRVFLDLKFHDIPNTVAGAAAAAAALGVWMLDVHASGGSAMMRAAKEAAAEAAAKRGRAAPLVVAITVLTSLDEQGLRDAGVSTRDLATHAAWLAGRAHRAGLDGIVASPHEAAALRDAVGPSFTIVTPGIRGGAAAAAPDDQRRTMTPREAVAAGADYLVIGRPIIASADPAAAADLIAAELT